MEEIEDRLDAIAAQLDAMERAQKRSNSKILRLAGVASMASQGAQLMILVNSTSWYAAIAVISLIAINAWMIAKFAKIEGAKEWPSDERADYEPYQYGK